MGEVFEGAVSLGQGARSQERQWRSFFSLTLTGLVDFYLPLRTDDQFVMRLIERQHMQDVSVGITLCTHGSGQLKLPIEDVLPLALLRCQSQVLNTCAHLILVAIAGVMADG